MIWRFNVKYKAENVMLLLIHRSIMDKFRLVLLISIQLFLLKEISSNYEIILERFEVLLGDEDQILENIDLRITKFNRSA